MRTFLIPAALAAATLLGGCMHPAPFDVARRGPFFEPRNHACRCGAAPV
jgi:hypothetical protein